MKVAPSDMIDIAKRFIGLPYIWGGDDPMRGYDCSGFVIEVLKSIGKLPVNGDWTAQSLYKLLKEDWGTSDMGKEGTIVFWASKGSIYHIEICLDDVRSIGASGGNSKNTNIEVSIQTNGYVKIRSYLERKGGSELFFIHPF